MCGILGGNNQKWNYDYAINSMKYRGPDGIKTDYLPNFVLSFARLAIIDLSSNGMQPMFSSDGRVGIVFNGEIYGYRKIRKELEDRYHFVTETDTEVILASYLLYGDEFIDKLDGMYGIAIWDNRCRKVKLYRDRMGIKPLYYFYDGYNFAFSSELKGITNLCDDVTFTIDETAIYDYLNYRYIPDPKTMYKNVSKVLPGYTLEFDIESRRIIKSEPYWELTINPYVGHQKSSEEISENLKKLISESVAEQMVSDVPVGTFLSGGVDSSIITYECSKINPKIETFSIGFDDKTVDEIEYVKYFLNRCKVTDNIKKFKRTDISQKYDYIKSWYDEPFADDSAFPTFLVSEFAKEKVTVVLTGDGGDEIFGGYPRYSRIKNYLTKEGKIDLDKIVHEYGEGYDTREQYWREQLGIPKDYDKYWLINEFYNTELPPITRCQLLDIKTYLPGDILTKVDRASMQVSLETRVPLLARSIVEYAFSLSEEDRCPDGVLKGALKNAYVEELGYDFLNRKKQGFGIPHKYFSTKETRAESILDRGWDICLDKKNIEKTELDEAWEYAEKHLVMVNQLDKWVEIKQKNLDFGEYFINNNIHTIAVYGLGIMGCRLIEELKDSQVVIKYGIDKNAAQMLKSIEVRKNEGRFDDIDAIVVTSSFYFDEIERQLRKNTDKAIINIDDILYEISANNE